MPLRYKLTRSEFQHMYSTLYWNHPKMRSRRTLIFVLLGALLFFELFLMTHRVDLACLVAVTGAFLAQPLVRSSTKRAYGQTYDMIAAETGETRVDVTETMLRASRDAIRSEIDWAGFTAIEADEVGFFLTYGPLQSIFIPRRVFSSEMEAQHFWDLIQSYWQHAKSSGLGRAVCSEVDGPSSHARSARRRWRSPSCCS